MPALNALRLTSTVDIRALAELVGRPAHSDRQCHPVRQRPVAVTSAAIEYRKPNYIRGTGGGEACCTVREGCSVILRQQLLSGFTGQQGWRRSGEVSADCNHPSLGTPSVVTRGASRARSGLSAGEAPDAVSPGGIFRQIGAKPASANPLECSPCRQLA